MDFYEFIWYSICIETWQAIVGVAEEASRRQIAQEFVMPRVPLVNFDRAKLRHAIERSGMSLTQIGAKGGIASATVSKALAGIVVGRGTAVRITMALDAQLDELLASDTPATSSRTAGAA